MMLYPQCWQCPAGAIMHKVKLGDTLRKLAKKYNTPETEIICCNPDIGSGKLSIGQIICIPKQIQPCPEENCYRVRPGDTFYAIARFFNISPDDLLEANPGMDPDKLYIGQSIYIPAILTQSACPPGSSLYNVQKEDTFYTIASRFSLPVSALMKANPRINPDGLLIGQTVYIPKLFNAYANPTYKIAFMYPFRWIRINSERYEGIDGFFQLSAISSAMSIEEVCRLEAYHKLKPYGSKPTIEHTVICGRDAGQILPSPDQPMEMREQTALIALYSAPVEIEGEAYNYFILWADKSHMKGFCHSLKFLEE